LVRRSHDRRSVLLISINVFSRHDNEAFSSLAIQDYKQFLRMKLDEDGTLTVFPVGIRRVPRRWKNREGEGPGPVLEPDDPRGYGSRIDRRPGGMPYQMRRSPCRTCNGLILP
jgi:hypothetical protein